MKTLIGLVAVFGVVAAGCGSDDSPAVAPPADLAADTTVDDGSGQDSASTGDDGGSSDAPEPVGPADMNTIRIGSQVWERTLPMTTGQCFVQNVEGLPPSGTAWGTLDGDENIRFSAGQNQDGTNEAEVDDQESLYWIAGPRSSGPDDLEIELDFDALTIVGQGTFTNLLTGETAAGSFAFQCEDDGSGG